MKKIIKFNYFSLTNRFWDSHNFFVVAFFYEASLSMAEQTPKMTQINYTNGGSYIGYLRGKERHGHGVYIDRHGNRYEGGWANDRAHGYGRKDFKKTQDVHEGYYEKDFGEGVENYASERPRGLRQLRRG